MSVLRLLLVVGVIAVLLSAGRDDRGPAPSSAGKRSTSADGKSSMSGHSADCRRRSRSVRVRLSLKRWPAVADHVRDVDQDFPRVLHLDRVGADENRDESLRGVPTRPGYDRDEYPPAVAREGGKGADVSLVRSSENRSSGAYMGGRLRGWCDGQPFRLVVRR